jgi:hypothetical protein
MANKKYPKYAEALLQAGVNLNTGDVKVALIDKASYTYSDSHQYLSSVSGIVSTSAALTGKTFTNGLFDAADTLFANVTGNESEAIILYVDTGSAATSPLLVYMDESVGGLPVTPNGQNINITWNASGIFQI